MIIFDILAALIAPCVVPAYELFLSKVNVPNIIGANESSIKGQSEFLDPFLRSLPSAFIGNSIWGITYAMNNMTWVGIYVILLICSVGLLIISKWEIHLKVIKYLNLISSILLILLTAVRILFMK